MPDDLRKKVQDSLERADLAELPAGTERTEDGDPLVQDAQTALLPPEELAAILERADSYRAAEAGYATGPGIDRRMGGPTGGDFESGGGPPLEATHAPSLEGAHHYGSLEENEAALEAKTAQANLVEKKHHGRTRP